MQALSHLGNDASIVHRVHMVDCLTLSNGSTSDYAVVLSGVTQESVLGPLLFLICADDMIRHLYSGITNFYVCR